MNDHLKDYSEEQIRNLNTLANFLASTKIPPPAFDIASYFDQAEDTEYETWIQYPGVLFEEQERYNECGTTACAIGHGPLAGIKPKQDAKNGWYTYSEQFCKRNSGETIQTEERTVYCWDADFNFMFGGNWDLSEVNNTAYATAKRIRWFLKNGVPHDFKIKNINCSYLWLEETVDTSEESV